MPLNTFDSDDWEAETPEDQNQHPCSTSKLEALKTGDPLWDYVVEYLIEETEDPESRKHFIRKILELGCVQGAVTPLIFAKDIYAFYDRFEPQIDQLYRESEQTTSQPVHIEGDDRKQGLAWFAFEEATRQIAAELGIARPRPRRF
ncbi:hypothetical protein HY772_01680 [Candidatus Woesearchaeota archaeon]|nr:hypothetical protein [Candidatus Woesearchaeota archaeon]